MIVQRFDAWLQRLSKNLSRKGLYEFLEKQYCSIPTNSDVLTVGSGGEVNKLLQKYANKNCFEVLSFDIDGSRSPDIIGDICTFDFGERKFDIIVLSEVLEHLHSPHLGLANIHNILKENGKLILTTPFILPLHDRPYDYFRFTRYGLEFLLKEFRNVHISERNSYFEAIDVLWVRLLQTKVRFSRFACHFIIPFVYYLKWPMTAILSKLIRTDAMTTGYVVTAFK